MRLATFNILHGQPVAGPADHAPNLGEDDLVGLPNGHEDLIAAVRELDADILGMQEVDSFQPRSGHANQTQLVARAMAAQFSLFVPSVIGTPGAVAGFRSSTAHERDRAAEQDLTHVQYGVSMVSRVPVDRSHVEVFDPAPLSLPLLVQATPKAKFIKVRDEQRAAIAVIVEGSSGPMTVVTAHLSFVPGFNVKQLLAIKKWLADFPRPLIMMGDLNLPGKIPAAVTGWDPVFRGATFPSYSPKIQFDHVLVDGVAESQLDRIRANTRAVRLPVSDHCAVITDVDI